MIDFKIHLSRIKRSDRRVDVAHTRLMHDAEKEDWQRFNYSHHAPVGPRIMSLRMSSAPRLDSYNFEPSIGGCDEQLRSRNRSLR